MQLSDYGKIIRKWAVLVCIGTALAFVVGLGVSYAQHKAARTSYVATDSVLVNYTVPPGTPYNSTLLSPQEAAVGLTEDATKSILQSIQSARDPLTGIISVSSLTDKKSPRVRVSVTAKTPGNARAAAAELARYVAGVENTKVNRERRHELALWQPKARRLKARWEAAQSIYNEQAAKSNASDPLVATLLAHSQALNQKYSSAASEVSALSVVAQQPAIAGTDLVHVQAAKPTSPLKTVIPAVLLGFFLSVGFAATVDYVGAGALPFRVPFAPLAKARSNVLQVPIFGRIDADQMNQNPEPVGHSPYITHGAAYDGEVAMLGAAGRRPSEILARIKTKHGRAFYITDVAAETFGAQAVIALAAGLAFAGTDVVIVDADPTAEISTYFGMTEKPGLVDFLTTPRVRISRLAYPAWAPSVRNSAGGSISVVPFGCETTGEQVASGPKRRHPSWESALLELTKNGDVVLTYAGPINESGSPTLPAQGHAGVIITASPNRLEEKAAVAVRTHGHQGVRVLGMLVNELESGLGAPVPAPEHYEAFPAAVLSLRPRMEAVGDAGSAA
jgi:hypothetical protein